MESHLLVMVSCIAGAIVAVAVACVIGTVVRSRIRGAGNADDGDIELGSVIRSVSMHATHCEHEGDKRVLVHLATDACRETEKADIKSTNASHANNVHLTINNQSDVATGMNIHVCYL